VYAIIKKGEAAHQEEPVLPRSFYDRATCAVAVDLLGRRLVVPHPTDRNAPPGSGWIVETEAYVGPEDRASHASRGRTPRTEIMFGPPGVAYVYLVYGMHYCLNAVTEREGYPAAVLIRAIEPALALPGRTDGPGRLCRALGIDRSFNGESLAGERIAICAGGRPIGESQPRRPVATGPRVGVAYAGEWSHRPWRFWLQGSPWVSRPGLSARR
jgi:DNA-3-methyladenine glycosylase